MRALWMAALGLAVLNAWADAATAIQDLRDRARADGRWRTPTLNEREALAAAVDALARDATCAPATLAAVRGLLEPVGMAVDEANGLLLVHDAKDPRGAGLLALRCGAASPLVWQAPHSFYDEATGRIAVSLMVESDARAAMWNTTHRYRAAAEEDRDAPVHPADVAHEPGNLFQATTVALAAADANLRFVQLHGFGPTAGSGGRAAEWDVIVSSGDATRPLRRLAVALRGIWPRVAVFGTDVELLGGTDNVQARALGRWPGTERFAHVELSREAREQLRQDAEVRRAFVEAVGVRPW